MPAPIRSPHVTPVHADEMYRVGYRESVQQAKAGGEESDKLCFAHLTNGTGLLFPNRDEEILRLVMPDGKLEMGG